MDSEKGGLTPEERQRRTAAEIARKKVLAAYSSGAVSASATARSPLAPARPTRQPVPVRQSAPVRQAAPTQTPVRHIPVNYQQTMQQVEQRAQQTGTMTNADWQKYHTAWQQYYQKYYSEYYAKAAMSFVEKEKLRQARALEDIKRNAENAVVQSAAPSPSPETLAAASAEQKGIIEDSLRARIQNIAAKQQKKHLNKKLIPILAGAAVVLVLLFLQYNRLIFAPIMAYVSPGNTKDTGITEVDPTLSVAVSQEPKLMIPKLNIDVPVHFGIPNDQVMSAMNNGVAQFSIPGADAMPGEIGNLAISGHSAGDIYSSNQYKFIFSGLERLENGDLIYIDYEGVRYTYKMVDRKEVDPSDVSSLVFETDKPMLTLITCWPLGVSTYRLLIIAEQINPAPSGAVQASGISGSGTAIDEGSSGSSSSSDSNSSPDNKSETVMPQNEPTFFERIWNWLTGHND
ncbi:sortase [Candidatus Saccharibacteria bacterium]|nr:sortase [Candidatus Saccharibacteria bacterium]